MKRLPTFKAEERAARREAALADGVPEIPDAETAVARLAHCDCCCEVAACRACKRGWTQLQAEPFHAEDDDTDGGVEGVKAQGRPC